MVSIIVSAAVAAAPSGSTAEKAMMAAAEGKELQGKKYRFETMVGEDFIYEIEQAAKHTTPLIQVFFKRRKFSEKISMTGTFYIFLFF